MLKYFFILASLQLVFGQYPPCPDTYGLAVYPDPQYCDRFFKCENGTLTLETCENGLLFPSDPVKNTGSVHNHCNYNWAVQDCGTRLAQDAPISTPGCPYQFGIYAKTAGCHTTFIKCAFGVPYENPCTPGLAYDDKTHSCNWPDLLLDICDPEQVTGFRCPDKIAPNTVAYKFWPFPRFAIPGSDCRTSITCVNGFPRLTFCEEGKFFDTHSLTCLDPEEGPKCA